MAVSPSEMAMDWPMFSNAFSSVIVPWITPVTLVANARSKGAKSLSNIAPRFARSASSRACSFS